MLLNLKALNPLPGFNLNNPILVRATHRANGMISSRYRLIILLNQIINKFHSANEKWKVTSDVRKKIFVFVRLIKAFASGHYKSISWKALVSIVSALIYFINPADIIPDIIPLSGFVDDFTILIWTYNSLQSELNKFLLWEHSNSQP